MGMEVLNRGREPTFHMFRNGVNCTSIIDITASSSSILHLVVDWRIDKDFVTLSDHRPILFSINLAKLNQVPVDMSTTRVCNTKKIREVFISELQVKGIDESTMAGVIDCERI